MNYREKYRNWSLIGLGIILITGMIYFFKLRSPTEPSQAKNCEVSVSEMLMPDTHMDGLIKQGQKLRVHENWYQCHAPEQGDLVLYRYSTNLEPVVKVIRAVAKDHFKVIRDQKMKAWNISVNGKVLIDELSQTPYYFGSNAPSPISLYEKAHQGVLKDGDVIVLSHVPPGTNDSGLFGVANTADLIGKIELVSD